MAFKLTKAEDKAWDGHKMAVQDALTALNAALEAAEQFRSEIHDRLESEHEDKSERWKEGERGQAASEMIETWADNIDEVELSFDLDGFLLEAPL